MASGNTWDRVYRVLTEAELRERPDRELLERYATARDDAAFAAILDRHGPLVRGVCLRAARDPHLAEDAFQVTFLVLARKASSLRRSGSLANWLFGVARRLAKKSLVSELEQRRKDRRAAAGRPEAAAPGAALDEVMAVLDEELARLPERYRAPLLACYHHGRTRDEAARDLGWNVRTLRRRLDKGRELLRARLAARGATLSAGLAGTALAPSADAALPADVRATALRLAAGGMVSEPRLANLVSEGLHMAAVQRIRRVVIGAVLSAAVLLAAGVARHATVAVEPPTTPPAAAEKQSGNGPYDPDPKHLWNRLHQALHVRLTTNRGGGEFLLEPQDREFDPNDLDPLLWHASNYLVRGAADEKLYADLIKQAPHLADYGRPRPQTFREVVAVLDEFQSKNGPALVADPLKRAFLQRDLWALFDSLAIPAKDAHAAQRRHLAERVARIIRSVALSREQIQGLPDNYAAAAAAKAYPADFNPAKKDGAFLPADLFQTDGPWVQVGDGEYEPIAPKHVQFFGGRSSFLAFIRLPAGRKPTLAYVKQLQEFVRKGTPGDVPQFPAGTQVALVRQMLLIDNRGEITPTRVTESVQIRVIHDPLHFARNGLQTYVEFKLRRQDLFARKAGGLRAITDSDGERPFLLYMGNAKGEEYEPVLASCRHCHNAAGIKSVNSFQGLYRRHPANWFATKPETETAAVARWKKQQYSWGLYEGLKD